MNLWQKKYDILSKFLYSLGLWKVINYGDFQLFTEIFLEHHNSDLNPFTYPKFPASLIHS